MDRKGFTLIELVMVMVLIGILAVFAAPKLGNITSTNAGAFTDKLRADVRYAQNLAMTETARTRVNFSTTSYSVLTSPGGTCNSFNTAVDPATGGPYSVTLNAGSYAGITLTLPAMTCLEYDSLGRPYNCTGLGNVCSTNPAGMTVTVNGNAVPAGSITITPQTGAVN